MSAAGMPDITKMSVREELTFEIFEHPNGETTTDPDYLVKRVHTVDGKIVKQEHFEGGVLVRTEETGD